MIRVLFAAAIGAVLAFGAMFAGYSAGQQTATEPSPALQTSLATAMPGEDEARIGEIVRSYLVQNPEVLEEVQAALEAKRDEAQRIAQQETIANSSDIIFNADGDGVIGNPDAKVTIVEFFDYNCTYCRGALADLNAMVEADPDIRFVLKEFPILGPDSQKAHVVSMAFEALMPGKYPEFHRKLLAGPGRADEDRAIKIALELGADEAELREAMQNPAIPGKIRQTYALANRLGITGTPSYVLGDEVVFGALGRDHLGQKVANIRNCNSATC